MSAQPTLLLDPEWKNGWDLPKLSKQKRSNEVAIPIRCEYPYVPMWEFEGGDGRRVATQRPVNVLIQLEAPTEEYSEQAYVFACPSLHVFASAASYSEAEKMFQDQVVYFYNHYSALAAEDLDADAQAIHRIYRNYFFERVGA